MLYFLNSRICFWIKAKKSHSGNLSRGEKSFSVAVEFPLIQHERRTRSNLIFIMSVSIKFIEKEDFVVTNWSVAKCRGSWVVGLGWRSWVVGRGLWVVGRGYKKINIKRAYHHGDFRATFSFSHS